MDQFFLWRLISTYRNFGQKENYNEWLLLACPHGRITKSHYYFHFSQTWKVHGSHLWIIDPQGNYIKLCIKYLNDINRNFDYSLRISLRISLIFSCLNIRLSKILKQTSSYTRLASGLETLKTHSKDILTSPLDSNFKSYSIKPNRFLSNRELSLLFSCNFFTPKFLEQNIPRQKSFWAFY